MEDDSFRTNTHFAKFADEADVKAAYEAELKARMRAAENEEEQVEIEDG
jgi:hypothetical protein